MTDIIETVEMYKTKDGSLFDSEKGATEHIVEMLGADIGHIISTDTATYNRIGHVGSYAVLMALIGDVEKCQALKAIVNKYL